jgi:Domain of unknown function (DUF4124)
VISRTHLICRQLTFTLSTLFFGTPVNKLVNLNWNLTAAIAVFVFGNLLTPDAFAQNLYKSVNAHGKITYGNHPSSDSKTAQNVSSLKGSPKFSVVDKQFSRASSKS